MNRKIFQTGLITIFIISGMLSNASAVDVRGPFKNTQTGIEYAIDSTGNTWLYGINALDAPTQQILGNDCKVFKRDMESLSIPGGFLPMSGQAPTRLGGAKSEGFWTPAQTRCPE
jgi:hypothetical protein